MTASVFLVVLLSALLHAGWNVVVKRTGDPRATTVAVVLAAGAISAVIAPFLTPPAPECFPWLAAGVVVQIVYVVLLAATHRVGDMSLVYPLMRGTAPPIVAVVSVAVFGDDLSITAWAGIACVAGGILSAALSTRHGDGGRGVALALVTACAIAGCTLCDAQGVRLSGSPIAYTLWEMVIIAVPFLGWAVVFGGRRFRLHLRTHLAAGVAGGIGTTASYGLALWAMTQAPVAVVAALRETSIVFALVLARWVLAERASRARILAAALVALGAAVLRLA